MKVIPIALAAHYATGSTTIADAIEIIRTDGVTFRLTSAVTDSTVDGEVYSATQGFLLSSFESTSGLAVGNMELTTIDDGTLFDVLDIKAGIWADAAYRIFRYNYMSPTDGIDTLTFGSFGEITLPMGSIKIELRDARQRLQQTVGNASSKTCRARFCDFPSPAGNNLCRLDPYDYTFPGAITSVTDNATFSDSSRTEADGEFTEGIITWITGNNAGLMAKIRTFASDTFNLVLPMTRDVEIGDEYETIVGCTKRRDEDCFTRFDNVVNFQGEPDRPGVDALTASPIPDA